MADLGFFALGVAPAILGLLVAAGFARRVLAHDEGPEEVRHIGRLIREGAMAFLRREYSILAAFVVVVTIVLAALIDYNVLGNARIDELNDRSAGIEGIGPWTAIAYLLGALGSGGAGFIGMSIAVRGNTRTASAAQEGLHPALRIAFSSGMVMGLSVVGIGLLGVTVLWLLFRDATIVAGFGFGASSIALFARVGGGIFTKAADVGADLVGKVEAGIPEDDPRNPATIADNVGDNVGDVAGMGADLFESYVGALVASLALAAVGAIRLGAGDAGPSGDLIILPLAIAGIGIVSAIAGTVLVRTGPEASMSRLLWALRAGVFGAGALALALTAVLIGALGLPFSLFWVVVAGLVVGQVIGTGTEYFTSYEYRPTRWIAAQAVTGHASVVIAGFAVGMLSVVLPSLSIVIGIWIANELAGPYGVALAAVGMLSTLGITLATDAYGPVADNAGGIAEQAHLAPEVRQRTDALDALGNTTAATGK
ncbi:MAG: sodium/proton-translocating pyrophosphatase, partial [Candidatus Limnocylindria bacterium]